MIEIPFVGQSYNMDLLDISAQRCVNLYPEVYDDGKTKVVGSLRSTHGLLLGVAMAGNNPMRGLYLASTGTFFGVRGSFVSSFDTSMTESALFNISTGTTVSDSTIVRFADTKVSTTTSNVTADDVNMLIADGSTDAYVWNITQSTATRITDTAYPGGSFVAELDGFFIVNKPGTLFAYYSALDDPFDWSTLRTITKEGRTDNITALIVHNGSLWLMGSLSYEVHRNTKNSNNQFLRVEGTDHDIGIAAPDSLAEDGSNVYWLAGNAAGHGKIYQSRGFDAVPISTTPIERSIHAYSTISDAEGFCFQQDGHQFYQLNFPTEGKTWEFDATTSRLMGSPQWHEKEYRNPATSTDESHRGRVHGFYNGKNWMGDKNNGNIYEVDQDTYTDNGDAIIRNRTSPTHWSARDRVFYPRFELDVARGVANATGQGSDPKQMLEISNDAGHTFGNKYQMDVGKIGHYDTRVRRELCGYARERVWRATYSEPTAYAIMGAFTEGAQ